MRQMIKYPSGYRYVGTSQMAPNKTSVKIAIDHDTFFLALSYNNHNTLQHGVSCDHDVAPQTLNSYDIVQIAAIPLHNESQLQ